MIDWHEFVVVETIEFTAEDDALNLQQPRKLDQVSGSIRQEGTPVPMAKAQGVLERNRIIDEEEAMEIEMDIDAEDAPMDTADDEVEAAAEEEQAADKEAEKPKKIDKKADDDEEDDALPIPDEDVNFTVRTEYTRNYQKAWHGVHLFFISGLNEIPATTGYTERERDRDTHSF